MAARDGIVDARVQAISAKRRNIRGVQDRINAGNRRDADNAALREQAARRGDDSFGRPQRPQTGARAPGNATISEPQVTDNKLNTENANIQNRGSLAEGQTLSILKFPLTIETDNTPYVLIKMFKSAVGTIQQTETDDPTNSIVAGVNAGVGAVSGAVDASPTASAVTDKAKQLLSGTINWQYIQCWGICN